MAGTVESFGRARREEAAPPQVMVAPVMQMPVQIVPDPKSLQQLTEQVKAMVQAAVRAGFDDAYAQLRAEAAQPDTAGDGG